jgi:hypothetical protein
VYPDVVIVIRPTWTSNRYGDRVPNWENATRRTVTGVAFHPVDDAERHDDTRSPGITRTRLITRPGVAVDISATDRIEHRDLVWDITGVTAWTNPLTGGPDHLEVSLQRITG